MAAKDLKNIKDLQQANEQLKQELGSLNSIADAKKRAVVQDEIRLNNQKLYNEALRIQEEHQNGNVKLTDKEQQKLNEVLKQQKAINSELAKGNKLREVGVLIGRDLTSQIKQGFDWLMKQDKIIKMTNLNLGMTGAKAAEMSRSFKESLNNIAQMGGRLEDVQKIMEGYADETGEARVLSAQMVEDITAIGLGTGLGVEQATKLAGQFRFMGVDARATNELVQGIVDTTERMGINTTKVLKNVNDNFKKLNSFTFQKGSAGMAQMAISAERTRVSMEDTMTAAEKGRTLEGAIDMMAQLQVMGGEFAKTDPLQFFHDSRNDPEKINEQISLMTRGMVSLRKVGDTFEKMVSPADLDRLEGAGKALGLSREQLKVIAQKRYDLDKLDKVLSSKGLTGREKELIEGAAQFDSSTSKYQVMLGGKMKDIESLTKEQANSFVKQTVSLEDRAKQSQTIEEAFKNSVVQLKSGLLPLLDKVNALLAKWQPKLEKFIDKLTDGSVAWWGIAGRLLLASAALKAAGFGIEKGLSAIGNKIVGSKAKGGGGGFSPDMLTKGGRVKKGAEGLTQAQGGLARAQGMKSLGTGAGMGVAAAGMGAGIGVAALGISKLADAMSKLTPQQATTLTIIVAALSAMPIVLMALTPAILAAGAAGTAGAVGLLALGAAFLMIGGGIGIAAMGIGKMAEGLGTLVTAGKDAGPAMLQMGAGIAVMGAGMMMFTGGAVGLAIFAATLNRISKHADDLQKVGDAFKYISAVMTGNKEDYAQIEKTVNAISNMNAQGGSTFAQLASILKSPLKVEFADKNVSVVSDITLVIDGEKFMHKVYKPAKAAVMTQDLRNGKTA